MVYAACVGAASLGYAHLEHPSVDDDYTDAAEKKLAIDKIRDNGGKPIRPTVAELQNLHADLGSRHYQEIIY